MDNLRIILVICGVLLLVGIYIWGVTVARRGSRSERLDDPDGQIENELELLERVQDSRAAQNAESLKQLNEIDIDEELEQAKPAGTVTETDLAAEGSEAVAEPPPLEPPQEIPPREEPSRETPKRGEPSREEERDEARFRPVFAQEARESPAAENALEQKTDLVASLSEIRATLAPDPVIKADQLELLREEKEVRRVEAREKGEQAKAKQAGRKEPTQDSLVLAITVMAKEGQRFAGDDLRHWFEALKLRHGEMGLFHYRPPGKPLRAPPTFSISSVLKPGSFDVEQMEDITVPGIAMFVQLPGPDDPVAAFEEMLRTARKLAEGLDGVVCDETRSTLTGQVINHMRERIAEYSRRQRLRF